MTDEEMAEEYICNRKCQDDVKKSFVYCRTCTRLKDFLAGLKASRPQWHKIVDGDLPKDDKQYLVLFYYHYKGKREEVYGVRDNLHSDFEIHKGYTEQIIAWCELPTFDKE